MKKSLSHLLTAALCAAVLLSPARGSFDLYEATASLPQVRVELGDVAVLFSDACLGQPISLTATDLPAGEDVPQGAAAVDTSTVTPILLSPTGYVWLDGPVDADFTQVSFFKGSLKNGVLTGLRELFYEEAGLTQTLRVPLGECLHDSGYLPYHTGSSLREVAGWVPGGNTVVFAGQAQGTAPHSQGAQGLYCLQWIDGRAPESVSDVVLAYDSSGGVFIDDAMFSIQMHALMDPSGFLSNYVEVRDLACWLAGTAAEFNVEWDGAVNLTSHTPYDYTQSAGSLPVSGVKPCQRTVPATQVDGAPAALDAFVLTDAQGGGHTFYKLRDLGQALGFNVTWDPLWATVRVETTRPYDPAN